MQIITKKFSNFVSVQVEAGGNTTDLGFLDVTEAKSLLDDLNSMKDEIEYHWKNLGGKNGNEDKSVCHACDGTGLVSQ